MYILLDSINFIYVFAIVLFFSFYYKINGLYFIFIIGHLLCIFIFNKFLFEVSYMPDQLKYLYISQNIREFNLFIDDKYGLSVYFASLFFALFPMPFIVSVYSIGMINFLLYFIIFIVIYKKINLKFIILFYLLFPSLALYSTLALRDMLIFSIMFFIVYLNLIYKKSIFCLLLCVFLYYIKFQNCVFVLISFVLRFFKIKPLYIIAYICLFYIFYTYFIEAVILKFNFIRDAFYQENYITNNLLQKPYSIADIIINIPYGLEVALFAPIPFLEINFGAFQAIQFVENCIIFTIISYIVFLKFRYKLLKYTEIKFLLYLLLISLIVYGEILFNSGTMVRYKFPFVTIYIIYSWYFICKFKNRINNKACAD